MSMKILINGKLIIPDKYGKFTVKENLVMTFNDKIQSITSIENVDLSAFDEVIDAAGKYVSPGFINIHIHGCAGFDTMDAELESLTAMQKFLPTTGVTTFLPTTMTMPFELVTKALRVIREGMKSEVGARILGANVEGPYISKKFKGAQDEKFIKVANFEDIAEFVDVVRIITLAPEELKDYNFVKDCHNNNIIVSIGHAAADYDIAIDAINNHGVRHIPHLFNAQTGLHHRKPGVVGAALDSDAVVELICDNVHVHPVVQRLVWKVKPSEEIVLITDSLRACGLSDGTYTLGGQEVNVKGELATLADGTLAGSVAKMNHVVRNFMLNAKISIAEAVELVTKSPAVELKAYDYLGSLEVGKAADFLLLDCDCEIHSAFIRGKLCHHHP